MTLFSFLDTKSARTILGEAHRVVKDLRSAFCRFRAVLRRRDGTGEIDEGVRAAGARMRAILRDLAESA